MYSLDVFSPLLSYCDLPRERNLACLLFRVLESAKWDILGIQCLLNKWISKLTKVWMHYLFYLFLLPSLNIKLVTSFYFFSFKLSPQPILPSFPHFHCLARKLGCKGMQNSLSKGCKNKQTKFLIFFNIIWELGQRRKGLMPEHWHLDRFCIWLSKLNEQ